MKVFVDQIAINLTDRHFIASGGQGSVYGNGDTAYKIYADPGKMLPLNKIKELNILTKDNIIKPESIIYNSKKVPIGYTMKYIKNNNSVCLLFTKSFKIKNKIGQDQILTLLNNWQETISHIHSKDVLIVDLNELNFLVNDKFDDIYAIDVDSYQTKSYPATVIMDSIRDRHIKNNNFTKNTDWFSYAVLAFQTLIGIHPYKGTYEALKHIPPKDRLDHRMQKNISVFNKEVTIPAVCEPLNSIPEQLKRWFVALFEEGKRLPPPNEKNNVVQVQLQLTPILSTSDFEIKELFVSDEDIIDVFYYNGTRVIITENRVYLNNKKYNLKDAKIAFTDKNNPIAITPTGFLDINKQKTLEFLLNYKNIWTQSENQTYINVGSDVLLVSFNEFVNTIASTKLIGTVLDLPEATKFYNQVIIQNLLGKHYASFFPDRNCYQVAFPEFDGYKIVDAKYESKVLVAIGIKNGKYDRFVFRFNDDFTQRDMRKIEDIDTYNINFTVNASGVVVLLNESENLEIFTNKVGSSRIEEVKQKYGDFKLFHEGNTVLFAKKNRLFSIRKL